MKKVRLSMEESEYLSSIGFLPNPLREKLTRPIGVGQFDRMVEISEEDADLIRDLCSERLAVKGFDENYAPTNEGRILEDLIDKLFVD
jgi:hypothetical protein